MLTKEQLDKIEREYNQAKEKAMNFCIFYAKTLATRDIKKIIEKMNEIIEERDQE